MALRSPHCHRQTTNEEELQSALKSIKSGKSSPTARIFWNDTVTEMGEDDSRILSRLLRKAVFKGVKVGLVLRCVDNPGRRRVRRVVVYDGSSEEEVPMRTDHTEDDHLSGRIQGCFRSKGR